MKPDSEKKMNIGVKFCGGCRCAYDRKAFLKEVKDRCHDATFSWVSMDEKYDKILIINGCHVCCVGTDSIDASVPWIWVHPGSEVDEIARAIIETTTGDA